MVISCEWGLPSHEGEYVITIPLADDGTYHPERDELHYWRLERELKNNISLSNYYSISNRGTRVEVVGPRNDNHLRTVLKHLGYQVKGI